MSGRPRRRLRFGTASGRHWLLFAAALVLALAVGSGIGVLNAHRLSVARYGQLLGVSRAGERVDLSRFGLRMRLDDVAVAPEFPGVGLILLTSPAFPRSALRRGSQWLSLPFPACQGCPAAGSLWG